MMKKTNILKTALIATCFTTLSHVSKAEIIYTDIVDTTLPEDGSPLPINFDGTGLAEFEFEADLDGAPSVFFLEDHYFMTVSGDEWDVIKGLSFGTTIDAGGSWEALGDGYIDPFWGTTPFPDDEDAYLGAKFKIGANVHYGWVRVLWADEVLTVKDFAYETIPNMAINAGATEDAGGEAIPVTNLTITGEGGASTINSPGGTLVMVKSILPADATNQSVTWSVANVTGSATINAAGVLTAVENGMVVVKAITNDGSAIEATDIITISNQTASINKDLISKLYIFPNPANDFVNIFNVKGKQILFISMDGKVLKTNISLTDNYTLDLSTVESGSYILKVIDKNDQFMIEKLIVK